MSTKTTVALLGAGNIAGPYATSLRRHDDLELVGVYDLDTVKRAEFAQAQQCAEFGSLDELQAASPDIVVNLTSAPHHYSTTKELLERGLTVFSEKPLALSTTQADDLLRVQATTGVRLACAPSLWLSEAPSTVSALVRSGAIGDVRLVTAEVNQGRIESWHPAPQSFFSVGPIVDAGVYPLALVTSILGPVVSVIAESTAALPERVDVHGTTFAPPVADTWIAVAKLASGALFRLSANFFSLHETIPRAVDFHGVTGSVRLDDWIRPHSSIRTAPYGQPFDVHQPGDDTTPVDWCVGVAELAAAIREDRPHRAGAEHAAHICEVLDAIRVAAETGERVPVTSSFPAPGDIEIVSKEVHA